MKGNRTLTSPANGALRPSGTNFRSAREPRGQGIRWKSPGVGATALRRRRARYCTPPAEASP